MSHTFPGKKKQIFIFLIFLFLISFINYLYQINNTNRLYTINLTLKNNISFDFTDDDYFYNKKNLEKIESARRSLEKYQKLLQLEIEEKINYEINYNKDLLQISNKCKKLKIQVQGKYYFFSCITSEPEELINIVIKSLSNVLIESLNIIQLELIRNNLLEFGIIQKNENLKKFEIIKKKIKYNNNIFKNIILIDSILIFIFIVYIVNFRKIKKIFF